MLFEKHGTFFGIPPPNIGVAYLVSRSIVYPPLQLRPGFLRDGSAAFRAIHDAFQAGLVYFIAKSTPLPPAPVRLGGGLLGAEGGDRQLKRTQNLLCGQKPISCSDKPTFAIGA